MTDLISKNLWDTAQEAQERAAPKFQNGKDGLAAFYRIRKILEPRWKNEPIVAHPLTVRILMASERNFQRLSYLADKLEEIATIEGNDFILKRLGVAREFPGAVTEMDFVLRLKHHGLPTLIGYPREGELDVKTNLNGRSVKIEITTLREDVEFYAAQASKAIVDVALMARVSVKGILARVPHSGKEISEIVEKIREVAKEAGEKGSGVKANLAGIFTFYISPERPGNVEVEFGFISPSKNKFIHVVRKKVQKISDLDPAIIVVYDRGGPFQIADIENYLGLDLSNMIGTYRNLAAVILICSSIGRFKAVQLFKDEISYIEHSPISPLEGESERIIVWRNKMYEHRSIVEPLIGSLTDSVPMKAPWLLFPKASP
jgi:hypothetical protein